MDKYYISNNLDQYIDEVRGFLPYPRIKTKDALDELRIDVQAALDDSSIKNPSSVFGSPRDVAKNISRSREWGIKRAGWIKRLIAFLIDAMIQMGSAMLFFILGFFFLFSLFMSPEEISLLFADLIAEEESFLNLGLNIFESLLFFTFFTFLAITSIVILFCYNILLERSFSTTIGKKIFGLIVVDESGIRITWKQAIIRNLTKTFISIEFLILDVILGIGLERQDSEKTKKQRSLDVLAETIVVINK